MKFILGAAAMSLAVGTALAQPSAKPLSALPGEGAPIVSQGAALVKATDDAGRPATIARITRAGSMIVGGIRAEQAWPKVELKPGRDYWMAFALQLKSGESIPTGGGADDTLLIFQTHTPSAGVTMPDIQLALSGQANEMRWFSAYNTKPSNTWKYVGGPNPDTEKITLQTSEPLPAPGGWTRFVVHYRPGYAAEHLPRLRVWRAPQGADYTQLFDSPDPNTYNSLNGASYPRIGPYKWSSSAWRSNTLAFLLSPLYFGEGADLLESGKASVAIFK